MAELDTIIGENGVDLIGNRLDQITQELTGDGLRRLLLEPCEHELRRPVDGDEEMQLALFGTDLGNVDLE